jgi:hypothetical protein
VLVCNRNGIKNSIFRYFKDNSDRPVEMSTQLPCSR